MSDSDKDKKVEIYHKVNKLKLKVGAGLHDGDGYIDPHLVDRAQTVIQRKEHLYKNEVAEVLANLDSAWNKVKSGDKEMAMHGTEELYHYANHIKDLATTYRYELMGYFGRSLREFAEKIDIGNKAHLTIVQAHIDVMQVVFRENIKDDGGEKAAELKAIVNKAIEKYF